MRRVSLLLAPVLAAVLLAPTLRAQTRVETEQVAVELRTHAPEARQEGTMELSIHFEVAPGWYIYAPDPGDVGLPTHIEWRLPEGARLLRVEWPPPERAEQLPFAMRVYGRSFVVRALLAMGDIVPDSATLGVRITWGACREVCVPQEAELSTSVRGRPPPDR